MYRVESEPQIVIRSGIAVPESIIVGHGTIIGYGEAEGAISIGENVSIGAFCVVHYGCTISSDVDIDHYCRVGQGATIGQRSKILYGSQLFNNCTVGSNCIIGGDLSERVVVEDNVTFMGSIAHTHRDPTLDWDTTDEPSPRFERGCVVGVDALIVGGITIGVGAYVAAGEIVRTDVPPETVLYGGRFMSLQRWRGFIKSRK